MEGMSGYPEIPYAGRSNLIYLHPCHLCQLKTNSKPGFNAHFLILAIHLVLFGYTYTPCLGKHLLPQNFFWNTHWQNPSSADHSPVLLSLALNLENSQLKRKRSPSKEPTTARTTETLSTKKPKLLRIVIPTVPLNSGLASSKGYSPSSLLSSTESLDSLFDDIAAGDSSQTSVEDGTILSLRGGPSVAGLFFDPLVLLPGEMADAVVTFCMKTYFLLPEDNQVMLFGRLAPEDATTSSASGLPRILLDLLDAMAVLLQPAVPVETHALLFPAKPTRARQAIINLYQPGEGITPHVDLLSRYGDGIVGVSFLSGSVMRFDKISPDKDTAGDTRNRWDLYLPERSMIVLTEEARYGWTHGIDKRTRDFVEADCEGSSRGSWIQRRTRMSITFRWLLPGADVIGHP